MTTGYVFEHEGKQYDPTGKTSVESAEEHNAGLERAELAFWQTKPERFAAYISKKDGRDIPTTWLGTQIGCVIEASKFRNNLTGSRMTHVRVRGNNGATYHGSFGSDWSQLVRLRRCKT
jgi:hypothetical protein